MWSVVDLVQQRLGQWVELLAASYDEPAAYWHPQDKPSVYWEGPFTLAE